MAAIGCQAQILQKGVKLNYGLNNLLTQMEINDWKSEVVNNGDVGVMARLNMWRLYLQPEVYFGINSWRAAPHGSKSTVSDVVTEWTRTVGLTAPMLLGYKLGSTEARSNIRVFAGPVFNKLIGSVDDYRLFSSLFGVGFDIAGTVSIDARYMMMFGEHEMFKSSADGMQLSLVVMF